jgi:nucleotide-binding universal stress UspA family protein
MEEKQQQIIILIDFSERSNIAIEHGIILSKVLEKEISLVCLNKNNEDEAILKQKMQAIVKAKNIHVYTEVIKAKYAKTFNELIPEINAILAIVCCNNSDIKSDFHPSKLLKMFHKSRIPYIFANKLITDASYYKKIILPIDATKESKEKVLWASYFGRFNESELKVMAAKVKDEFFLRQLNNNLKFIKKIFENLEVNYNIIKTTEKQNTIDKAAIHTAAEEGAGMVIILSTKSYNIIDLLRGPKELALITNKENVSVMCLNPRDDLYVMCD